MFGKRRGNAHGPVDGAGEPLTNSAITEAMMNLALEDTPDRRALLFQLLLDTTLVAATPQAPKTTRTRTVKAGETLDIVTLTDDEGSVLPLFTNPEALIRWQQGPSGYLALPSRAIFEMAVANGINKIVVDPGSSTWGSITRYEIEQLGRGRLPLGKSDIVAESTNVRIGKPARPPSAEALAAIRVQLADMPSVLRAWYFLMQQGALPPERVIAIQFGSGIDPHPGPMRTIIDRAGEACDEVRALSFIVADGNWPRDLSDGAGELFFERERKRA